jgi:hypothetical protein
VKTGMTVLKRKVQAAFVALTCSLLLAGCAAIGPSTVARDRFDYVSAISESWKRQTLLNLLKTRYQDAPVFMDVTSVINQYALEGQMDLGFEWKDVDSQRLSGKTLYTDRPTISYTPLMGEKFAQSLLRPIPIGAILLLVQAGYPIEEVLRICVQSINGLDNRFRSATYRNAEPGFYELLTLLRRIQLMDGMRFRVRMMDNKETLMLFFREPKNDPEALELKKVLHLLELNPEAREFRIVFGNFAESDLEIAILSRSMMQVMSAFASYIEVPETDISEGRVTAVQQENPETMAIYPPLIRVRSGVSRPDDAYVAVPYRKNWFWIDDQDMHSKEYFSFLMIMFSFTERGDTGQAAPVITVPTN